MDIMQRMRPEAAAGGYAHDDSTVAFYLRINALIGQTSTVLDLGAGRGAPLDGPAGFPRSLRYLRGRVAHLAGCDVDRSVLENPHLDEARIIAPDGTLPYGNDTFDLIVCDWVLEHIDNPAAFAAECHRVLKPGGWLCARTPSKWGYIGLSARLVPASLQEKLLGRLQPQREPRDVFPKRYRLNTLGAIGRSFPSDRWHHHSYALRATPAYHGGRASLFRAIELFQAIAPAQARTVLMVFLQKR